MSSLEWVHKRLKDALGSVLVFGALLGLSEFIINAEVATRALVYCLAMASILVGAVLAARWLLKVMKGEPWRLPRPDAAAIVFGSCAILTNLVAITRPEIYFSTCAVVVVLATGNYLVRRTQRSMAGPTTA